MSLAFERAARIHGAMSRQEPDSDLVRIAALRPGEATDIGAETTEVLALALALAEDSGGLFDPVVPGPVQPGADWRDIMLAPDGRVSLRRPLLLSLDGLAKGWAADRLLRILREEGATEAIVDAGGDLALDCLTPQPVGVRDPAMPGRMALTLAVQAGGIASSGAYGGISGLWDLDRRAVSRSRPVTVVALDCATADAATKVAAQTGDHSTVLHRWRAVAYYPGQEGRP